MYTYTYTYTYTYIYCVYIYIYIYPFIYKYASGGHAKDVAGNNALEIGAFLPSGGPEEFRANKVFNV